MNIKKRKEMLAKYIGIPVDSPAADIIDTSGDALLMAVSMIEADSINICGEYTDVIINGCCCYFDTPLKEFKTVAVTKEEAIFITVTDVLIFLEKEEKITVDLSPGDGVVLNGRDEAERFLDAVSNHYRDVYKSPRRYPNNRAVFYDKDGTIQCCPPGMVTRPMNPSDFIEKLTR